MASVVYALMWLEWFRLSFVASVLYILQCADEWFGLSGRGEEDGLIVWYKVCSYFLAVWITSEIFTMVVFPTILPYRWKLGLVLLLAGAVVRWTTLSGSLYLKNTKTYA